MDHTSLLINIISILILLLLSGLFSGSETALTAASRARMHQLAKDGNRAAKRVNKLRRNSDELISAILLGNNLVNILASALATNLLVSMFNEAGVVYATIIMTMLVLIFSEVLPKTYAINNADKAALKIAPVVRLFVVLFRPFNHIIQHVTKFLMGALGVRSNASIGESLSDEELRGAIELHEGDASDMEQEKAMLRSILDLDDVDIGEIMVHRKNVTMIDVELPNIEIIQQIMQSAHTRIPLWKEEPENIVGVLHAKEVLKLVHLTENELLEDIDITNISSDPWFVPETTSLLGQLQAFRRRQEHFAMVVDEYGSFMGIVTLEDILEEIVGDISDEHDESEEIVTQDFEGAYLVPGSMTIRDLNRDYNWDLPDEEAATIAGLILHESRKIPEIGQIYSFHGFRFEILKRQRNQITLIKVIQEEIEPQDE